MNCFGFHTFYCIIVCYLLHYYLELPIVYNFINLGQILHDMNCTTSHDHCI